MDCPRCNAPNRAEARFCAWCGASLSAPPLAAETPVPAAPIETLEAGGVTLPGPPSGPGEIPPIGEPSPAPAAEAPAPNAPLEATPEAAAQPAPAGMIEAAAQPPLPVGAEEAEQLASPAGAQPANLPAFQSSTSPEGEPCAPASPPPPGQLPPGSLLAGRFEVLGVVGREGDDTLYQAWDRARCWQCGAGDMPPGEAYCAACGAELAAGRALCRVWERLSQPGEALAGAIASFDESGRWYVVLPAEEAPAAETGRAARSGLRLVVGLASHPGQVRQRDEDSLLALTLSAMFEGSHAPALGFYAVADGLGGYEGGQVASCSAVRIVADWVARRVLPGEMMGETCLEETAVALLTLAVKEANAHLYQLRQRQGSDMGSTLTAALVRGDMAVVVNVGDSRTYLWRNAKLEQVTADHSAVARLVAVGEIRPEDMYTHPQRSTIYRSLGDKPDVEVDSFVRRLAAGDRLLLCCDGVWESLRPDGLEEALLAEPDPQRAADEMIKRANLAGGEDNLSVIIVSVEGG